MGVPFPLSEIYYYVLVEGWKMEELWRSGSGKDLEIGIVVYRPDPGVEDHMNKTGKSIGDCLHLLKHLRYTLYGDK